jgi:hypothetical protein
MRLEEQQMATWTAQQLSSLERADEIRVAGRRDDGTLRPLVIIWHVVVDGVVYVRSVKGARGQWFAGVLRHRTGAISWNGQTQDVVFTPDGAQDAAIDSAYAAKYGNGSATRAIVNEIARLTTLRIDPGQ